MLIRQPANRPDRLLRAKLDPIDPVLEAVVQEKVAESRSDILRQGEVPTVAHVVLEGHTYRYRLLNDGRRQITAVLMPGDVCDLEAVMRGRADYGVGALTRCVLGEIPAIKVADLTTADPGLARALWRRLLRDEAISREWLVGMGCRSALERVAHLLCEFRARLSAVGLTTGDTFELRLTQTELGDLMGLSTVHVNRVLQQLRRTGLIELSTNRISFLDVSAMEAVAGFDPAYLQM